MTVDDGLLAIAGGRPVRETPYDTAKGAGYLDEAEIAAAVEVLRSRSLFRYYGPELLRKVEAFEARFRELLGVRYAVGVSSGTAALQVGLVGLGVEDGDEVIIPAVTFIATVGAAVWARAVPVFAEVDDSLTLDPASFEANITPKTKAVIPVHLANIACDMDPILNIARRHNIAVLEDAAQAIGVAYHGRYAGTIGDAGAFSLQLDKNITTGEGGVLATHDWRIYDRAVRYQDQGGQFTISTGTVREHRMNDEPGGTPLTSDRMSAHTAAAGDAAGAPIPGVSDEPFIGTNLRMTELAGAIAAVQLTRLPDIIARGRRNAQVIRSRLGDLPVDWRRIPDPAGEGGNVTMFFPDADLALRFGEALRAEGIPCGRLYGGQPVYANPAVLARRTAWTRGAPFASREFPTERTYSLGLCPRSEDLLARSLTIGVGPRMSDPDVDDTVRAVRKVAAHLL